MSRVQRGCFALLCTLVFAAGCADDANPSPAATPCTPGTLGCAPMTAAGSPATAAGSMAPFVPLAGSPMTTAGVVAPPVAGATAPTPGAMGVPCDVAQIVTTKCTGCHQTTPKIGAPMPLMTHADFHAVAFSDKTKKVYQTIPGRLDPVDPTKRMPQPPLDALTMPEKQTFNTWLSAGAPAMMMGAGACEIKVTELGTVAGPGPGAMPSTGSGGAHVTPIEYNDPEMTCHKFLTHARGDKTKPWMQGRGEQYINFDFKAPWTGTQYMRAAKISNDPNSTVIHHWLLFKLSGPVTDGAANTGSGIHPSATLVHAWGPGASPIYLDPDVGVLLESDVGYQLEAHFNNATSTPGADSSGAEICVTTKKPDKVAELVWVGSDSIAGTSATGRCAPRGPFPIKIIAAQPHMHKLGSHMKVTVNRAGGMAEVIHDKDFAFDSQIYYVKDIVLNQGDTMTTTCSYSGFASFGMGTSSEMCYFFSLAYPAGSLRAGSSLIHGPATCM